jgi:UPF0716 protein FxsA
MYCLIQVGTLVGALSTIALVVLTAAIGLILLRLQGFQTLMNARGKLMQSELPTEEIFTGIFLAIGGALLLTPGFITDFIGFICLVPFSRHYLMTLVIKRFFNDPGFSQQEEGKAENWIEGEYKKEK